MYILIIPNEYVPSANSLVPTDSDPSHARKIKAPYSMPSCKSHDKVESTSPCSPFLANLSLAPGCKQVKLVKFGSCNRFLLHEFLSGFFIAYVFQRLLVFKPSIFGKSPIFGEGRHKFNHVILSVVIHGWLARVFMNKY